MVLKYIQMSIFICIIYQFVTALVQKSQGNVGLVRLVEIYLLQFRKKKTKQTNKNKKPKRLHSADEKKKILFSKFILFSDFLLYTLLLKIVKCPLRNMKVDGKLMTL